MDYESHEAESATLRLSRSGEVLSGMKVARGFETGES